MGNELVAGDIVHHPRSPKHLWRLTWVKDGVAHFQRVRKNGEPYKRVYGFFGMTTGYVRVVTSTTPGAGQEHDQEAECHLMTQAHGKME